MFNLLKDFAAEETSKQKEFDQLVEFIGGTAQQAAPQQAAPQQDQQAQLQTVTALLNAATDPNQLINNPKINQATIENVLAAAMAALGKNQQASRQYVGAKFLSMRNGSMTVDQFKQEFLPVLSKAGQQKTTNQTQQAVQQGRLGMKPQLAAQQANAPQNPTMGNQNATSQMQPTRQM